MASRWVIVEVPRSALELPDDMCANCGTADDLTIGATVAMPAWRYGVGLGWAQSARVRTGTCRDCAVTMTTAPPDVGGRIVLFLALWLGLMFAGWAVMIGLGLRDGAGKVAAGAVVVALIAPLVWLRRPARAPRTSNYQPIRLVAAVHRANGTAEPGLRLAFSNPRYAERVGRAVGASLAIPAARVVRR